jgi:Protein of unknown function (DUF2857)
MDRNKKETYRKIAACLFDRMFEFIKADTHCNIDSKLLLELSEMDVRGRSFVEQHATHFISLHVDTQSLSSVLEKWHLTRRDIEQEDQFLLLQAPQTLMQELFHMNSTTFSWRRRLLGLKGEGRHRPFDCDQMIEKEIWSLWHKYRDLIERDRYLKVNALSNHSISIIASSVRRYNEASINRK